MILSSHVGSHSRRIEKDHLHCVRNELALFYGIWDILSPQLPTYIFLLGCRDLLRKRGVETIKIIHPLKLRQVSSKRLFL